MMMPINRRWLLARRPTKDIQEADFVRGDQPAPSLRDGEFLVRSIYLGFEPAMRIWMTEQESYVPPVGLGQVMRAQTIGRVIESRHRGYQPGDAVMGWFGWQDYAIGADGRGQELVKLAPGMPAPSALNLLGLTGLTAYVGMMEIGRPRAGDTVVISGCAGATGTTAAQLARLMGCRVIGIAGGAEKCAWLTGNLGLDEAIDYRSLDFSSRLSQLCPDGIDVYFDNVGGPILEAVLDRLAIGARVVLCGAISQYGVGHPQGPGNYFNLTMKRARMEGFIVSDFESLFPEARRRLAAWAASGVLVSREDVAEGFEAAPQTLQRLFRGDNAGKQLLRIDTA